MKTSISCLAVLLAGLAGCLQPSQPDGTDPAPGPDPARPVVPVITDGAYWSALADRVDAGRIADTDELLLIVKEATAAGDLRDAAAIDRALPDAGARNHMLDTPASRSDVAQALRKLSR